VAIFVLAHGAWSAAWAWKKVRPLLRARGHELYAPTLTGLGERGHHASPAVDLETHISDVVAVLDYEDLRDVILIGHSYGGMVATGVADRVPERLRQLIYLDAFVPTEGKCLLDYLSRDFRAHMVENAADGWRVPANPIPPDTSPEDVAWIEPRRLTQPLRTFQQPVRLKHGETTLPRSYIYCRLAPLGDPFRQFAERAKREGWRYFELDASHSPNVTAPAALTELLAEVATPSGS
jgi:pimeloyl-ACP methyl ester carboxylesterase